MAIIGGNCGALRAGSHFDISISTSINISIRKVRKICVNLGYISISVSINIRKWKKVPFLIRELQKLINN